jgi:hypothetical protein
VFFPYTGGKTMENKIIDYLGIEPEFVNEKPNKAAIKEAKTIEKKYKNEIENNIYSYSFHDDIFRFYDKTREKIIIIEKLKYITVFRIENI